MGFWDIFTAATQGEAPLSGLHEKVKTLLPGASEDEQILVACISGLFARVIYTDFEVHKNEIGKMREALNHWTNISEQDIEAIITLSIDEIKDLSGLENHKYAKPLRDILHLDQRYGLLESLFTIAACDGSVSEKESEEIRVIANGLNLEHKHFISARASVMEYLGALNKN